MARAVLEGAVDFRRDSTLDEFVARWTALPGIGPWTAQYIALRALGHPDAFPAEDLVLQRALPGDGSRLSARALHAQAERVAPVARVFGDPAVAIAMTPPQQPGHRPRGVAA